MQCDVRSKVDSNCDTRTGTAGSMVGNILWAFSETNIRQEKDILTDIIGHVEAAVGPRDTKTGAAPHTHICPEIIGDTTYNILYVPTVL